ncbi:MAG: HPP family protein [Gammaproteobacteria bacterium]|jgi:CBS domain-containing membrane protein
MTLRVRLLDAVLNGLGACVSILAVSLACGALALPPVAAGSLIGSFGASAVLLFSAPQGRYSRAAALFGGHTIGALCGVFAASLIPDRPLAGALAVGLSVALMRLCRCTHPPGGATALIAVIGGPEIEALHYYFLVNPVLVGCTAMFAVARINIAVRARFFPGQTQAPS